MCFLKAGSIAGQHGGAMVSAAARGLDSWDWGLSVHVCQCGFSPSSLGSSHRSKTSMRGHLETPNCPQVFACV